MRREVIQAGEVGWKENAARLAAEGICFELRGFDPTIPQHFELYQQLQAKYLEPSAFDRGTAWFPKDSAVRK